jgi:hypothetical protein
MRKLLVCVLAFLLTANSYAGRGFGGSDIIIANGISTALDVSSGPITISAWFYPTDVSSEHNIVSHWQGVTTGAQFIVTLGGSYVGGASNNNVQYSIGCCGGFTVYGYCSTAITTGSWWHVLVVADTAGVYGSPSANLYLNGISCGGVGWTENRTAGGANFNIGGHNGTANFQGRIAEVGYWNAALSPAERLALSKGVSPATVRRTSLIGYFPLYGAGSPEPDLSGNKNNGTLTGTTVAPHCPCGFAKTK